MPEGTWAAAAGYIVTVQPFTFDRFVEDTAPVFERTHVAVAEDLPPG